MDFDRQTTLKRKEAEILSTYFDLTLESVKSMTSLISLSRDDHSHEIIIQNMIESFTWQTTG
jgi:hypothetical protein